jgi:hypothetical protein
LVASGQFETLRDLRHKRSDVDLVHWFLIESRIGLRLFPNGGHQALEAIDIARQHGQESLALGRIVGLCGGLSGDAYGGERIPEFV